MPDACSHWVTVELASTKLSPQSTKPKGFQECRVLGNTCTRTRPFKQPCKSTAKRRSVMAAGLAGTNNATSEHGEHGATQCLAAATGFRVGRSCGLCRERSFLRRRRLYGNVVATRRVTRHRGGRLRCSTIIGVAKRCQQTRSLQHHPSRRRREHTWHVGKWCVFRFSRLIEEDFGSLQSTSSTSRVKRMKFVPR